MASHHRPAPHRPGHRRFRDGLAAAAGRSDARWISPSPCPAGQPEPRPAPAGTPRAGILRAGIPRASNPRDQSRRRRARSSRALASVTQPRPPTCAVSVSAACAGVSPRAGQIAAHRPMPEPPHRGLAPSHRPAPQPSQQAPRARRSRARRCALSRSRSLAEQPATGGLPGPPVPQGAGAETADAGHVPSITRRWSGAPTSPRPGGAAGGRGGCWPPGPWWWSSPWPAVAAVALTSRGCIWAAADAARLLRRARGRGGGGQGVLRRHQRPRSWRRVWNLGGKNFSRTYHEMIAGYRGTARDVLTSIARPRRPGVCAPAAHHTDGIVETYRASYLVRDGVITAGHATLLTTG